MQTTLSLAFLIGAALLIGRKLWHPKPEPPVYMSEEWLAAHTYESGKEQR